MSSRPPRQNDLIFGARRPDPAYWRDHPDVTDAEVHFDGLYGCVRLGLRPVASAAASRRRSVRASLEETRDDPDFYFWGEACCPVDLFERAPRAREVKVWIEGPAEGDNRTCWSVGLWLNPPGD